LGESPINDSKVGCGSRLSGGGGDVGSVGGGGSGGGPRAYEYM